jgi:hypothetical protein
LLSDPLLGTSRWIDHIAEVTSGTVRLRIDTDRRKGAVVKLPGAEGKVDGADVVGQFTFPGSRVTVRACTRDTGSDKQQLELVKGGKSIVLKKAGKWLLSPSPDGKWLAVRELPGAGNESGGVIFLVSSTGEHRQFAARLGSEK